MHKYEQNCDSSNKGFKLHEGLSLEMSVVYLFGLFQDFWPDSLNFDTVIKQV